MLSVPVTYTSLKNKQIDVFLGNWMPTMEADRKPYIDDKSVDIVGVNLEGAKYTLAVPDYPYEDGLKSFADIAKFKDKLDGKIYGIEPGNDGNRLILDMIKDDKFGLKGFEVVESSEQGMLSQVERATKRHEPIVFLGWEPHPMNVKYKIDYLSGGDDVFGPNYGGATVYTNERAGFAKDCPNVGKLHRQPEVHAAHGEPDHGLDPVRRAGARQGRDRLAEGQSRRARRLARRRDHLRWPARPSGREEEPRPLVTGHGPSPPASHVPQAREMREVAIRLRPRRRASAAPRHRA